MEAEHRAKTGSEEAETEDVCLRKEDTHPLLFVESLSPSVVFLSYIIILVIATVDKK